ncbi:Dual specificity protein phosphatase 10 [Gryganskiella cystojenkinii]|nr:Dual specificity protein phosphatase 10 [Gryganskiella cystojenkinii]
MSSSFSSKRNSQLSLDEALPSPRFPKSISTPTLTSTPRTSNAPRTISAYFSDFSIECGAASPYVTEPVMVLPSLYLGAEHNATDLHTLKRLGITFVLNVAVEIAKEDNDSSNNSTTAAAVKQIDGLREGIEYQSLAWSHHQRNLLRDFPKAFRMIDEATTGSMNGGKVLVHCQLGVSRSASLVIACVMRSKGMGLSEAYDFVKQKSGVISPNMSLMYQLAEFEKDLARKKTTTTSPSSSSSPMSAGSRKSWESQMEEDEEDEPPYPFAAAFSEESSQSETSKNNLIVPTLRDTMVMPMEMSTTPIRQEFHMKRPLTPDENSRDEYPNNKPFLNAPRLAYPRLSSVPRSSSSSSLASRRWSVGHSPLSKVSTPPSSPPSSPQQHQRASMSLSPKTPTTEQFSTMSLSNDRNNHHDDDFLMMMIPETPSFLQTTFSIPPPLSSSCSSSSASSVSSFEACSRLTSLNSNATSSHCSFFTAGDDDEDEQAEEEEDSGPGSLFSPRNSWNLVPVPKSSGSTSASSLGQQQKKRRNLWSGLQTMQVLAEGAIPSTFMGHDDDQDGDDEVEMSESHHIEAIKSSPGSASGRQVAAPRRVTASGSAPRLTLPLPDFIFSPRPYNTPTVATATARSFEEVYEALFMEN